MLVVLQVSSQERATKAGEKTERAAPITFALDTRQGKFQWTAALLRAH
jgi:hypothetical protein